MKVLVTRPASQAAEWAQALRGHGLEVDGAALDRHRTAERSRRRDQPRGSPLRQSTLVVFVSPNAAEQFFALKPAGAVWPGSVQAASPGPGTSRVLERLGVPAARIIEPAADAAQFDSESLWAQLRGRDWHGVAVLIVRGDGGREWLADTLARPRCVGRLPERLPPRRAHASGRANRPAWPQHWPRPVRTSGSSAARRPSTTCSSSRHACLMEGGPRSGHASAHCRAGARHGLRSGARMPPRDGRRGGLHTIDRGLTRAAFVLP